MKSGFWSRTAAVAIDIVLGLILCYVLHWVLGYYFASRAVVTFNIGATDSLWKGPILMLLGIAGTYVYTFPFALFLVFFPEAIFGCSVGKWILGMRMADPHGVPVHSRRLWLRFFIKTSGLFGMTLALLFGSWELAVVSFGASWTVFLGFFLTLGNTKRSLCDRLSGTAVFTNLAPIPQY